MAVHNNRNLMDPTDADLAVNMTRNICENIANAQSKSVLRNCNLVSKTPNHRLCFSSVDTWRVVFLAACQMIRMTSRITWAVLFDCFAKTSKTVNNIEEVKNTCC